MKKYLWIFLIGSPLLAMGLVALRIYYSVVIWTYNGKDQQFVIKSGETFSRINYRLHKEGLISNAKLFHRYAQVNGFITKLKAGQFMIKNDANMLQVVDTLLHGSAITTTVTIPEGKNLYEIAKLLQSKKITLAEEFIKVAKNPKYTKKFNIHADTFEGYLYPDTYKFTANSTAHEIIKIMVTNFKNKVKGINLEQKNFSKHKTITLASIVEKETGASHERPIIAGVFLNRLKKGMRLQSDPTTIYGIYENFNGNLRKKDLLGYTPYNTYKVNGLPAGPISNPGLEAIQAVLNPSKHHYLYFVSKNDGTHIFTKSYKDHLTAVKKWQMNRQNRKGKSWRDLKKTKVPTPLK